MSGIIYIMSAKISKNDKSWLLNVIKTTRPLNDLESALVFTTFDSETNQDITIIEKEIENEKFLKKVCLYKLLTFIPEIGFITLLFDKKVKKSKMEVTSLYYKYYRNKINLTDFQNKLKILLKEGNIV